MSDSKRLVEYSLGSLDRAQRERLDAEVARSETLREELRQTAETLARIGATTGRIAPSARLRGRLMASLEPERQFEPYVGRLEHFLDLSVDRVEELLRLAAAPADGRWRRSGLRGMRVFGFEGGPNIDQADCRMLKMELGFRFPAHRHAGNEWGFVLQGRIEEDDGAVHCAGDIVHQAPESRHSFRIAGDQAAILFVLLEGEIEWLDPNG